MIGRLVPSRGAYLPWILTIGGVPTAYPSLSNYAAAIAANVIVDTPAKTLGLISGAISGAFTLTKNGDGTIIISGANTFNAGTTLNGGLTIVTNAAAFGNDDLAIAAGAMLRMQSALSIHSPTGGGEIQAGANNLAVAGVATVTFSGAIKCTGTVSYSAGAVLAWTLNNPACSFVYVQNPIASLGVLQLNFPANAGVPCTVLNAGQGLSSNGGANTGGIRFVGNDNQLAPTCRFSAASNRAYGKVRYIDLNGTNQVCGGITNELCPGGAKYVTANRGAIRNGHATTPCTLTINNSQISCSDSGSAYKAITNGGAAALGVIKKGVFSQTFAGDTQVIFTGNLSVQQGILATPQPSSAYWEVVVDPTAPVATAGTANSGQLQLSSGSPNLAGKTINILCMPTAVFAAYTVISWDGTASNIPATIQVNGVARTPGTPFAIGARTCVVTVVPTGGINFACTA